MPESCASLYASEQEPKQSTDLPNVKINVLGLFVCHVAPKVPAHEHVPPDRAAAWFIQESVNNKSSVRPGKIHPSPPLSINGSRCVSNGGFCGNNPSGAVEPRF